MKKDFKYYSSYLVDRVIERRNSEVSGWIELTVSRGRLRLNTKNATYSYEDLYTVFQKGLKKLPVRKWQLKNILVLGFGLGSVAQILEQYLKNQPEYTAVELDKEVIDLGKKYLDQDFIKRVDYRQQDALKFIQSNKQKFDLIVVDVFVDTDIPEDFRSDLFLNDCKKAMHKKSKLLYNCLTNSKEKNTEAKVIYKSHFENAFKQHKWIPAEGNVLLFGEGLL